jgi:hypothetical protein
VPWNHTLRPPEVRPAAAVELILLAADAWNLSAIEVEGEAVCFSRTGVPYPYSLVTALSSPQRMAGQLQDQLPCLAASFLETAPRRAHLAVV